MADPKYANLPGIALDEPDVYETSDLPESEQAADFYEKESETIEKILISPDQAFNQFKGKYLKQGESDFSERISSTIRTGYSASSGNWELNNDGHKETPLEKFNRLKCEYNELLEDITKMNSEKNEKVECLVTSEQIEEALKKLKALSLEGSVGHDALENINNPQSFLMKQLESQLEQFKVSQEGTETQNESDGIIYQINYKPELMKLKRTNRLAELESRIHHLEAILGASNEKLTRLSAGTSKGSLLESAQHLAAVANLLDSAQLDHIEGRLTALSQKLESIEEKKRDLALDEEKNSKVVELYDMVKNSENLTDILPKIVERMKSLENIHKRAADLMKTLTEVEMVQTDVVNKVSNNKVLLQGVQESFANNLNEINQTIVGLDNRIKALKAKKEKK